MHFCRVGALGVDGGGGPAFGTSRGAWRKPRLRSWFELELEFEFKLQLQLQLQFQLQPE